MNVLIDSNGWIEYFSNGVCADRFAGVIEKANSKTHYTPTLILYEVFKKIKREFGEEKALHAIGHIIKSTSVIELTQKIAVQAADISLEQKLAMADAIIKATADECNAKIITSDPDFKQIKNIIFIEKK